MAKKKRKSGSRGRSPGYSLAETGGLRLGLAIAGAVVGLGAAAWGAAAVHSRAGEVLSERETTVKIVWPTLGADGQTWLGDGLRTQITARVESLLGDRPLDASAMAAVGKDLAQSGWFDAEPRVLRDGASAIRIEGVWREPACAVRAAGRDYPVDWQGRPFPIDYPAGASGLRVLVGVGAAVPLDAVGMLRVIGPWPGEDVQAGLGLLGPLLSEPFAGQVAGVDVSGYFTSGALAIVTERDTRVVWGGRFGEFVPGEATTEKKLDRLRRMIQDPQFQQRIDGGTDRLDVSGEHLILDRTGSP